MQWNREIRRLRYQIAVAAAHPDSHLHLPELYRQLDAIYRLMYEKRRALN
jgi:hypothetical protein